MLFLLRLVARIPLPLLHAAGVVLGWVVYLLSPRYRRVLRSNLDAAGLSSLRSAVIGEYGKAALEVPAVWLRPHARAAELVVEVRGWEHVEVAARLGKGLIIVTPHLVRPTRPGDVVKTPVDDVLPPNDPDFFLLGKTEVTRAQAIALTPVTARFADAGGRPFTGHMLDLPKGVSNAAIH